MVYRFCDKFFSVKIPRPSRPFVALTISICLDNASILNVKKLEVYGFLNKYLIFTNIFYILQSYQISILWKRGMGTISKTEKLLFFIPFSLVWGCRYILFDVFINNLSTIKLILKCHICASIKCICALISWSLDSLIQRIVNSSIIGFYFKWIATFIKR